MLKLKAANARPIFSGRSKGIRQIRLSSITNLTKYIMDHNPNLIFILRPRFYEKVYDNAQVEHRMGLKFRPWYKFIPLFNIGTILVLF